MIYFLVNSATRSVISSSYCRFLILIDKFFTCLFLPKVLKDDYKIIKIDYKKLYELLNIPKGLRCPGDFEYDNLSCFLCDDRINCMYYCYGKGDNFDL